MVLVDFEPTSEIASVFLPPGATKVGPSSPELGRFPAGPEEARDVEAP
jgi:hypothetical protein